MTTPTFCDDWCLVLNSIECGTGIAVRPAECVTDCELTRSGEDCFPLQEQLLECYAANSDALTCVGNGFSTDLRVKDGACQEERDTLFECEAPGISDCLGACRVVQEQQLASESMDAGVPVALGGLGLPLDGTGAAALESCPRLDVPCEDTCWTLFAFSSEGLEEAGFDPNAAANPEDGSSPAGMSGQSIAEANAACVLSALEGCFPGAVPMQQTPGINGDAGAPISDDEPASIGDVISQCLFSRSGTDEG